MLIHKFRVMFPVLDLSFFVLCGYGAFKLHTTLVACFCLLFWFGLFLFCVLCVGSWFGSHGHVGFYVGVCECSVGYVEVFLWDHTFYAMSAFVSLTGKVLPCCV